MATRGLEAAHICGVSQIGIKPLVEHRCSVLSAGKALTVSPVADAGNLVPDQLLNEADDAEVSSNLSQPYVALTGRRADVVGSPSNEIEVLGAKGVAVKARRRMEAIGKRPGGYRKPHGAPLADPELDQGHRREHEDESWNHLRPFKNTGNTLDAQ